MLKSKLQVLYSHGIQYIKHLDRAELPAIFRGRPVLTGTPEKAMIDSLCNMCPTGAIRQEPFSIDLGRCMFCGECALRSPDHIHFTNDYRMGTNVRDNLIVVSGSDTPITFDPDRIRKEIRSYFGRALKLREVSAGGDNSCEMELNASMNVNFDFGRYGIDFVASPRHADGIVITGPITENMAIPLELCFNSVPQPRLIILAGSEAISGGLHSGSNALNRSFLKRFPVDLYLPGNPVHPLTFISGIMTLLDRKF